MGNSDNVIGYIEYLSDDGKIVGYVTPFTDVDKFRKEILKAAEVGMPITPVVFPDKMDKPLGLPRDIYWPGGFRKEKRQTYPYEIYQTNNRDADDDEIAEIRRRWQPYLDLLPAYRSSCRAFHTAE